MRQSAGVAGPNVRFAYAAVTGTVYSWRVPNGKEKEEAKEGKKNGTSKALKSALNPQPLPPRMHPPV